MYIKGRRQTAKLTVVTVTGVVGLSLLRDELASDVSRLYHLIGGASNSIERCFTREGSLRVADRRSKQHAQQGGKKPEGLAAIYVHVFAVLPHGTSTLNCCYC
ncbi:hypothetical protein [Kordiimonas sp.]|uniref:hypothetical protein n=1 Tax=Kordiimonas sp. TaxID=1970157 RepID=UPI003A8F93EC